MKISVVISTYNGEKYVIEQLDSINKQTRRPDEVIIKDDCSTDDTIEIIKNYIVENDLSEQWKIIENEKNLGWRKNFIELLKFATGDLIFLCDQDDIWMSEKVEKMSQVICNNQQIKLLASDVEPFYEDSKASKVYHPRLGKRLITKVKFDIHICEIRRPGCTYCLKRELVPFLEKMWFDEWAHDSALWAISLCQDGLYSLEVPLIKFRRHASNNSPSNEKTKNRKVEAIVFKRKVAEHLLKNKELLDLDSEKIEQLKKLKLFLEKRLNVIENKKKIGVFLLLRYLNYYPRWRTWLVDALATFR